MKGKILVTGGAGFIGSNLVEELVAKKYSVVVLDNFSSGYIENLNNVFNKITIFEGDIRDKGLVSKIMKDVSSVFHLAAMVSVPESIKDPQSCYDVNVIGSLNLIKESIKNNSRFIFASSAAVYGDEKSSIKTENIVTNPISPYGLSKVDVEKLAEIYSKESGLKFTCFRNFNVYGPKQDVGSSYAAVIPKFINSAISGKDLTIFGDGKQTRDFIYVKDVTSAYIMAMEKEIDGIFNLGNSKVMDINGLAKIILKKINPDLQVKYEKERIGDIKHSKADSKKYQIESGWKPEVTLENGIEKTIGYYRDIELIYGKRKINAKLKKNGKY